MMVDLHEPVFEIIRRLGFEEPNDVKKIVLTPRSADVEIYCRDEHGRKFVAEDIGQPATETRFFQISTVHPDYRERDRDRDRQYARLMVLPPLHDRPPIDRRSLMWIIAYAVVAWLVVLAVVAIIVAIILEIL